MRFPAEGLACRRSSMVANGPAVATADPLGSGASRRNRPRSGVPWSFSPIRGSVAIERCVRFLAPASKCTVSVCENAQLLGGSAGGVDHGARGPGSAEPRGELVPVLDPDGLRSALYARRSGS